jgi:dTDP-4-dehydrorhamnose reductase
MKIEQVGVTGYMGRVGSRLVAMGARPIDVDVTQEFPLPKGVELVINCAAKSSPAWCEDNPDHSFNVTVRGMHNLINACYPKQIPIVQISSDHVFSGYKLFGSYREQDKTYPLNWYGNNKRLSEVFALGYEFGKVVRTSVLFDDPTKLSDYSADRVSIVIKRSFMHLDGFAACLKYYVENFDKMPSVLHISGTKKMTWHKFLSLVKEREGLPNTYKRKWWYLPGRCPRPINGGLNVSLAERLGVPVESVEYGIWRWYVDKCSSLDLQ